MAGGTCRECELVGVVGGIMPVHEPGCGLMASAILMAVAMVLGVRVDGSNGLLRRTMREGDRNGREDKTGRDAACYGPAGCRSETAPG